ncbi:hypothetical protein C0214_19540 [Methylobacterium sp. DM1]|nr:hypothetical protein C0214_19540 [Methylobacterium sp. DM1]
MSAPLSFEDLRCLERLLEWHENSARSCGDLADGLAAHARYEANQGRASDAEGTKEAERRNRVRAKAHADTARFLSRLMPRHDSEATPFRDHLKPKDKAQIRAPP